MWLGALALSPARLSWPRLSSWVWGLARGACFWVQNPLNVSAPVLSAPRQGWPLAEVPCCYPVCCCLTTKHFLFFNWARRLWDRVVVTWECPEGPFAARTCPFVLELAVGLFHASTAMSLSWAAPHQNSSLLEVLGGHSPGWSWCGPSVAQTGRAQTLLSGAGTQKPPRGGTWGRGHTCSGVRV